MTDSIKLALCMAITATVTALIIGWAAQGKVKTLEAAIDVQNAVIHSLHRVLDAYEAKEPCVLRMEQIINDMGYEYGNYDPDILPPPMKPKE